MVFVWRGSGITVPIFLFISGWITSNWFDDDRLGNLPFVGWSMLWAGIILTLQGAAVWGGGKPDPDTGAITLKKGHDFFWIPVLIWGLGFIGLGIWFINKEPVTGLATGPATETTTSSPYSYLVDRTVHIYNPYADSATVTITDLKTKAEKLTTSIPAYSTRYTDLACVVYYMEIEGQDFKEKMRLYQGESRGANEYKDAWYVLGGAMDIILVDVTDVCDSTIIAEDIIAINWKSKVKEVYNGKQLVEPFVKYETTKKPIIYSINSQLPLSHTRRERIYALIPVENRNKLDEKYLDDWVYSICFK